MICTDIPAPMYLIFSDAVPRLIYYSHIPASLVAIFLGLFVFYKNGNLASKVLLSLFATFSLWVFFSLIVWTNVDSSLMMFVWSLFGILDPLIFFFSFYFIYVFVFKKDIGFKFKLLLLLIISPAIVFNFKNTIGVFDMPSCEAKQGGLFDYYIFSLEILFALLIGIFSFIGYRKAEGSEKKKIVYASVGILLFFLSFFTAGFIASYLAEGGVSYAFEIEQYGLFGMTFFMGMLAYLIVKFKAFNIKLLGAQALVATQVILIASQFAFIRNNTNRILTGITLFLSFVFGYYLIRSVKKEVEQKEELQIANREINLKNIKLFVANHEISEQKDKLQKTSDKLAVANSELKKLDQAKSDFIARASHDLRTPITGIKGYISLLEEGSYGEISPEQKTVLGKTSTVVKNMSLLVEDLFSASKIESGVMKYDFAKWKIEGICQEVMDTLFIKAKDNGLYLKYEKPETPLPELTIDGKIIREAVSNLVDNAVKYCPAGGVTLTLARAEESGYVPQATSNPDEKITAIEGPVVRITVSDTGIGVPKDEIPHLFAKFSRGKDTTRLNASGTGLGLYICKGFIEGNGGKIWVESEGDGKGSQFIVELPIEAPEEIAKQAK